MSSPLALVGMVSSYREGPLVAGAIRSLLEAGFDHVYVYEGPAGEPLEADVPESLLEPFAGEGSVTLRAGRWRTDARKRTAMLHDVQARHRAPVWGLWLDGDELLFNGRYLRDWLHVLEWHDQLERAGDPTARPHLGRPLRLIELDGSVTWCRGKLIRVDQIRDYEVSSATFTNARGILEGQGNVPDSFSEWGLPRLPYFEADQMLMRPPISGEPHLLHRSLLRHPLRRGLRLHEQEALELDRKKAELGLG